MPDEDLSFDLPVDSSGLPVEVENRIRIEVPGRAGDRTIACLRTACWLLSGAARNAVLHEEDADDTVAGLRLGESAAYNLREALGSVAAGRDPAEGGLRAVRDAWTRFRSVAGTEAEAEAQAGLHDVLDRISRDDERSGERTRQLLTYLRAQAGAEPLRGQLDPVVEYGRLWGAVNDALHTDCPPSVALDLLDRTRNWFVRMFTAPDAQVQAVLDLAATPWQGPEQLDALTGIIASPHHLRLFFSRLLDPAWLAAMLDAELVPLPHDGEPWPVAAVTNGLGRTHPAAVTDLLSRLAAQTRQITPPAAATDFELLRVATHLGQAGHAVVGEMMRRHGRNSAVQSLGVHVALEADPRAPIVVQAARAVIGEDRRMDRQWGARELLERLETGLTEDNRRDRVRFLAGKARLLAAQPLARYTVDIASLHASVEHVHETLIVLAHHLVGLVRRCQVQGVSTAELQRWIGAIDGPIGERITCQVLADALDVPVEDKIAHLARRLASSTATGDDRDLVEAILASDPDPAQLAVWYDELGMPSPAPNPAPPSGYPDDWARVWRWSAILPSAVLSGWQEQIDAVSTTYGDPKVDLDQRHDRFTVTTVASRYSTDELRSLSPATAARRIAAWRPDPQEFFHPVGARELARTLEALVGADLEAWTRDPLEVLVLLREPVYVLHYLRALTSSAAQLGDRAPAVLSDLETSRATRGTPTALGSDDGYSYESTWDCVDTASVELIKALAEADCDLHDHVGMAWQQVLATTRAHSDLVDGDLLAILGDRDALHSAINRPWSKALDAAVSLARWEASTPGSVRLEFVALLDEVIEIVEAPGLEFRAILAARRLALEAQLPAWLDDRADVLFRHDPFGPATLDQTLKWSHPSAWLLDRFAPEIYAAARRGADNALSQLLIAMLHRHSSYSITDVVEQLQGDENVLRAAAEEVPALLQPAGSGAPTLVVGLEFWRTMLDAPRRVVPTIVLEGVGRWAFVDGLDTDQWLTHTHRTLQLTDGRIDYPIEVAQRAGVAAAQDTTLQDTTLQAFTLLIGKGEPWERSRLADLAVEALGRAAQRRGTPAFDHLRTRLLELGRHEVAAGPGTDTPVLIEQQRRVVCQRMR